MSKIILGALLLVIVLLGAIFLVAPLSASAQTVQKGCFYFTENGHKIGIVRCNAKANDLEIVFKPTPTAPCILKFTLNGKILKGTAQKCPQGENDVSINWTVSSTGFLMITGCNWTPIPIPCRVPVNPNANDAHFLSQPIVQVFWTLNGKQLGSPIFPPTGANDVDFKAV